MVMLTSNSKFDHYRRNEAGGSFTTDEAAGNTLFNTKCASCHATDLMTDDSFRNNGRYKRTKAHSIKSLEQQ
jgi:cytochrome c peroxidase